MAEPTPHNWPDSCRHCGRRFKTGEPRWLEQRRYFVHTECARWHLWETPPYVWALKDLRKRYRQAGTEERARIAHAGAAIREMERAWPANAAERVARVAEALRDFTTRQGRPQP
ncbi:MAG: hypothetical protein AAF997_04105 [Myxococcota bacterium]